MSTDHGGTMHQEEHPDLSQEARQDCSQQNFTIFALRQPDLGTHSAQCTVHARTTSGQR